MEVDSHWFDSFPYSFFSFTRNTLLKVSSKRGLRIWEPAKMLSFILASFIPPNLFYIYFNAAFVLSIAITEFFIKPNVMWKSGNNIFFDSTSGGCWTFFLPYSCHCRSFQGFWCNKNFCLDCPIRKEGSSIWYIYLALRVQHSSNFHKLVISIGVSYCYKFISYEPHDQLKLKVRQLCDLASRNQWTAFITVDRTCC